MAVLLFMGLLLICDAYAAEKEAQTQDKAASTSTLPEFFDDDSYKDLENIEVSFLDTMTVGFTWEFPYSDEFFTTPPDRFSPAFACGSLGLASSTFRSTNGTLDPQYEVYLTEAGFHDLYSFGYDKPTETNSLSGVIGRKQIGDFTVIAAAACGQGYEKEWGGNLQVGAGDVHEGFSLAARIFEKNLKKYVRDNKIKGKKKLWLAGYSRAGAVANLTAADMIASGEYEDVYAYLFGVPANTKHPEPLTGIYNILGQYDPVPQVPFDAWGFKRYGTDLCTPAQETDIGYTPLAKAASEVSKALQNDPFRNNPELNYQLHLILEFISELFPTNKDYAERFQDILMETWKTPDAENIHTILSTALKQMSEDMSTEESNAAEIFLNYVSFVAGQHIRADQRQVEDGSWDTNQKLDANLILEHRAATYLKWMFSDSPESEIYRTPGGEATRHITFLGDIGLEVWKDGKMLRSIDLSGKVETPDSDSSDPLQRPFLMRNGKEVVLSLPADGAYRLLISSGERNQLTYFDVTYQTGQIKGIPGNMFMGTISDGEYEIEILPGEELPSPDIEVGSLTGFVPLPMDYSSTSLMKSELDATSGAFISINQIGTILISIIIEILLLLIICLIIYLVHRKARRNGHPPYSNLYVIIPHVILIVIFTALTEFLSYFMFSVVDARAISATLAILLVLLLQIRGLIRRVSFKNLVIALLILLLIPMMSYYYNGMGPASYSLSHTLIYFAIMAVLTIIAIRSFYRPEKKPRGSEESVPADQN